MIANATQDEIDGFFSYGGRVEVCYNGTYAPICDQGWGEPEATVICGIWGYYSPSYSKYSSSTDCLKVMLFHTLFHTLF